MFAVSFAWIVEQNFPFSVAVFLICFGSVKVKKNGPEHVSITDCLSPNAACSWCRLRGQVRSHRRWSAHRCKR